MKLIELLRKLELHFDDTIKKNKRENNIAPDGEVRILLKFMAEDQTHINTYVTHPILQPYYDKEIEYIEPIDSETIGVWFNEDNWWCD